MKNIVKKSLLFSALALFGATQFVPCFGMEENLDHKLKVDQLINSLLKKLEKACQKSNYDKQVKITLELIKLDATQQIVSYVKDNIHQINHLVIECLLKANKSTAQTIAKAINKAIFFK